MPFRRRPRSRRRHPTPEQAYAALSEARCLYDPISTCSGPIAQVGLHDNEDIAVVLVCRAHYGRLRQLEPKALDRLEGVLRKAFNKPARPAYEDDPELEGVFFLRSGAKVASPKTRQRLAQEPWRRLYGTRRWKDARRRTLIRVGRQFQRCGNERTLDVHHIPLEDGGAPF